ncbi:MAG: GNAT family N-acetyltransferase [Bacillota bacterium]
MIRRMIATDIPAAVNLMTVLARHFTEPTVAYARQHLSEFAGFVAEDEQCVVGFIAYFISRKNPQLAKLAWMGVHPSRHRQGIGGRLLAAMEDDLAARGVDEVEVVTLDEHERYPEYGPTRAFYRQHGYQVLRREADPDEQDVILLTLHKRVAGLCGKK